MFASDNCNIHLKLFIMKTRPLNFVVLFLILLIYLKPVYTQDNTSTCQHTPIEVKEIDAQKSLVIKADVPMSAIGEKMGELYGKLFAFIGEKGIQPAGPAFAIYYSWEPEGNVVFEAGVPVVSEVEGSGEIVYKEFPVMKTVTTLYSGAYETMEPVYTQLQKYMEENKLESTGCSWEVYLTDPQMVKNPEDNKTLIYFPLK